MLVLTVLIPLIHAATIFNDGFESGDFSAWTSQVSSGAGSTITVESADPYAGSYHGKAYCEVATAAAYTYKDFTGQPTVYAHAKIQIRDNLPSSGNSFIVFTVGANSGATTMGYVNVYNDGGTVKWQLGLRNGASVETSLSSETVSLNTYYEVELKVVVDNAAGEGILYIGGVEAASLTGKDTNNYGNIDRVHVGERYSSSATTHTVYFDNVTVADTYIGPDAGEPAHTDVILSETPSITNELYTQKSLYRSLSETTTVTSSNGVRKTLTRNFDGSIVITTTQETQKDLGFTIVDLLETLTVTSYLETLLPVLPITTEDLIGLIIVFFVISITVSLALIIGYKKRE